MNASVPGLVDHNDAASEVVLIALFAGIMAGVPACAAVARLAQYMLHRRSVLAKKNKRARKKVSAVDDSRRARLHLFLYSSTNIGFWWDVGQAVLAFISCLHYIIGTYTDSCNVFSPSIDTLFEIIIFIFFTTDYLLALFLSRDKLLYIISPVALADLLCILPTLLQFGLWLTTSRDTQSFISIMSDCDSASFFFAKSVRLIRIMRVMRMVRVMRSTRSVIDGDSIYHQLAYLATLFVSVILVSACVFQWAEVYAHAHAYACTRTYMCA